MADVVVPNKWDSVCDVVREILTKDPSVPADTDGCCFWCGVDFNDVEEHKPNCLWTKAKKHVIKERTMVVNTITTAQLQLDVLDKIISDAELKEEPEGTTEEEK